MEPRRAAYLVVGPESSGTRMLTRLLIAGGCAGDGSHAQRWDKQRPQGKSVVWRRSFPHDGQWPDLKEMQQRLRDAGYDVMVVVIHRDWRALADSQVMQGHAKSEAAAASRIADAYLRISAELARAECTFWCVTYEALARAESRVALAQTLGLSERAMHAFRVEDGNLKHYRKR